MGKQLQLFITWNVVTSIDSPQISCFFIPADLKRLERMQLIGSIKSIYWVINKLFSFNERSGVRYVRPQNGLTFIELIFAGIRTMKRIGRKTHPSYLLGWQQQVTNFSLAWSQAEHSALYVCIILAYGSVDATKFNWKRKETDPHFKASNRHNATYSHCELKRFICILEIGVNAKAYRISRKSFDSSCILSSQLKCSSCSSLPTLFFYKQPI